MCLFIDPFLKANFVRRTSAGFIEKSFLPDVYAVRRYWDKDRSKHTARFTLFHYSTIHATAFEYFTTPVNAVFVYNSRNVEHGYVSLTTRFEAARPAERTHHS